MKKALSFLLGLAFFASGGMLAISKSEVSSSSNYKTMYAMTRPVPQIVGTTHNVDTSMVLPQDLLLGLAKKQGALDTVYITKTDTITEQVTTVKVKKVAVPSPVIDINVTSECRVDTVEKPVYYLATQSGVKEGPDGKCVKVYEIHQVDEICPEKANSCEVGTDDEL